MPSAAIRRRIELAAADRFGICANVRFSFLAQWLWRQIGHVVPQVGEVSPFTTPVLTWRVLGIFDDRAFVAAHPPIAAYLRQADDVMRHELAARTAALLEQYLTYRPDWLAAWLAGKPAKIDNLDGARAAGRALAGRAVAAHRPRSRRRRASPLGRVFRGDAKDGRRRPGARRAAGRGTRVLPADDATAVPRHPAAPRPMDRSDALRGQSVPRVLARGRRRAPPLLPRRAVPCRPPRSRQPAAGGVGPADAGAHRFAAAGRQHGSGRRRRFLSE